MQHSHPVALVTCSLTGTESLPGTASVCTHLFLVLDESNVIL